MRRVAIARRRACALALGAGCALALATVPARAEEPAAVPAAPTARPSVAPATLLAPAGRRLGGEFAALPAQARVAAPAEREAAALRWLDEALAPLAEPACRPVLAAAGLAPAAPLTGAPGAAFPEERPVARPGDGATILVPAELGPLGAEQVERFRAIGLLPFEIALTGEVARAMGAAHAGPPPGSGLLRLTRAARLEGVARLAGTIVVARGLGVESGDLGTGALTMDRERDEAGIPRAFGAKLAPDAVRRALFDTYFDDGLRWALFHFLRGGLPAVVAALERPGVGPEALLRPGVARPHPLPAEGCRLGPRASLALLGGDPDAAWLDTLLDARAEAPAGKGLVVALAFEDERTATRARLDLAAQGVGAQQEGAVLRASPRPDATRVRSAP